MVLAHLRSGDESAIYGTLHGRACGPVLLGEGTGPKLKCSN
jgi:hypothetical protein